MDHIGFNIKRKRETLGLSQQNLADKSGISKAQISRLESGKQDNPQIKTLIPIATALGVSIEELTYGENIPASSMFLLQALDKLPDDDKNTIRKTLRAMILMSQSEQLK